MAVLRQELGKIKIFHAQYKKTMVSSEISPTWRETECGADKSDKIGRQTEIPCLTPKN